MASQELFITDGDEVAGQVGERLPAVAATEEVGDDGQPGAGAAAPGVTVTLTETRTNISSTATTNQDGNYVFSSIQDGVYRVAAAGKEITPPLCFLKLPPTAGQTWKVESTSEGTLMQGTFSTHDEDIEVPAFKGKKAPALKAVCEDFQMGKHRMKLTYWFVQRWGMVKQHVEGANFDVLMELEKYQPAAK